MKGRRVDKDVGRQCWGRWRGRGIGRRLKVKGLTGGRKEEMSEEFVRRHHLELIWSRVSHLMRFASSGQRIEVGGPGDFDIPSRHIA